MSNDKTDLETKLLQSFSLCLKKAILYAGLVVLAGNMACSDSYQSSANELDYRKDKLVMQCRETLLQQRYKDEHPSLIPEECSTGATNALGQCCESVNSDWECVRKPKVKKPSYTPYSPKKEAVFYEQLRKCDLISGNETTLKADNPAKVTESHK